MKLGDSIAESVPTSGLFELSKREITISSKNE
jgi:hypothetical protein